MATAITVAVRAVRPAEPASRSVEGRVARLYARLQDAMLQKQETWKPASVLADPGARRDLPLLIRRALTVARILEQMPLELAEDELIVGKTAIDGVIYQTGVPEFATPEEKQEAAEKWTGPMTATMETSLIGIRLSHKTPDYPDVMARGISGILGEIDEAAQVKAQEPPTAERDEALLLYRAMKIECEAVITLANRYAELAEQKAQAETNPVRRAELLQIAEVCWRVPAQPPRTFWEALQATWFVHYAFFSTKSGFSLGRFDQYCGPYLDADLEAGRLTLEQAREVLGTLWLKFNDRAQILRENFVDQAKTEPWPAGARIRTMYGMDSGDAVNHWGQNIVLSGIRTDGSDGTNRLTYLCLDCLESLQLTSPVTGVRLHRNSPPELVRRCAEVLKTGGAMPIIFNDDAIIPAYVKLGVPIEDARDYADSNCWETMIAGKSDQEIIRGVNFLLILEWVLNRGLTRTRGIQEGIDIGDPRGLTSFAELMDAWKRQIDTYISDQIDYIGERYFNGTLIHSWHGPYAYNPLLSAMVKDCIARGKDVIRGGARYVLWHMTAEAVANCTDALAAIKKFVFDDKTVTMDTVLSALAHNWEGYETLRRKMITRAPKFANDDPAADAICKELMDYFVVRTRHHAARHPRILFPPSVGTYSWYHSIGREVSASCDGRLDQDPVTSNFSPTFGMDRNGPTAAIRSYSQMNMDDLAAGAPDDLRFAGSHLKGEVGTARLAAFIRSFVELGGNLMTLMVTDEAILRAAIADPMKYRSLRVRMGGWSAYFIALSPEQQRVHLSKVEHGLA